MFSDSLSRPPAVGYDYHVNFEFPIGRMAEALGYLSTNIPDWQAYPTLANLKGGGMFLYATIDRNDGQGVQVRGVCHSKASPRAWLGFCHMFEQECVMTMHAGGRMGIIPRWHEDSESLVKKYGQPSLAEFVTFDKAAAYISGRIEL